MVLKYCMGILNVKLNDAVHITLKRNFVTDISNVYLALFSETFFFFKSILTTKKCAVIHFSERYASKSF